MRQLSKMCGNLAQKDAESVIKLGYMWKVAYFLVPLHHFC